MKKPNLFLVGAPRCGTTAMCHYLSEHPGIYVPKLKEPNFFANDFPSLREVDTYARYEILFQSAEDYHECVMDGSVLYMYSMVAIENIFRFNANSKLLVMLRNPVDMVYSFHGRLLATFKEDEQDFEKAWRKQAARETGRQLPQNCQAPELLQYRSVGRIGAQLEKVLDIFPKDQVHVTFFDDFIQKPRNEYSKVLAFLGQPLDVKTEFPRRNAHIDSYRINWLAKKIRKPPALVKLLERKVKDILRIERLGAVAMAEKILSKRKRRKPIASELRAEIFDEFRDDVERLSEITGRDLSNWK